MTLSAFERAIVLDAGVRRLIRHGMRPGDAVRTIARENQIATSDVLGAVIDVRHMGREGVL